LNDTCIDVYVSIADVVRDDSNIHRAGYYVATPSNSIAPNQSINNSKASKTLQRISLP